MTAATSTELDEVRAATQALNTTRETRDEAIRRAFGAGVRRVDIAAAAEITRARVYQIARRTR